MTISSAAGETQGGTGHRAAHGAVGADYEDFISSVYVTAIRLGVPSRSGLRSAGLDDESITVATRELVARRLLTPGDDPDVWHVVPPREALTSMADAMERRARVTRAAANEFDILWRRTRAPDNPPSAAGLESLVGVAEIGYRLAHRHRTATRKVWWLVDSSPAAHRLFGQLREQPGLLDVREGVERRLILDTALLDDDAAMAHAEHSRSQGQLVAVAHGLPFSALLSDSSIGVIDLTAFDTHGEGSAELRATTAVQALGRLCQEIWDLSTPYGADLQSGLQRLDRLPLTERDQRILTLLATGASDQVIARQTSVSVRTVERRVRYLMNHLGAATRFQAGVQAARRGWI